MTLPLHLKYRPRRFADVIGQVSTVKSMQAIIERDTSHAFLLSGPSGVGKTTLARVAAKRLGCDAQNLIEIDAATNTGIESMRSVQDTLRYVPFGKSDVRVVIVDEAHMLSKSAWNSLLKSIEEPPEHAYWFFATTEFGKVPPTIKTRCTSYQLNLVQDKVLVTLYDRVVSGENIKLSGDIGDLVVREAHGSPRQMLINLELVREASNKKEAAEILRTANESDPTLELCRFLVKGGSWSKAMGLLNKLDGVNPEGIRIIVVNYMASVASSATSDRGAGAALNILDAFSTPFNPSERQAPLLLSIGRVLLGE